MDRSRPQQRVPESPSLRERDERLEALKRVIGRMSHDFNNYLAPILGYVALLKEEIKGKEAALKYADRMEESARKTESIIESILLLSMPHRRFRPESTDLTELIRRELAQWSADLPQSAHVTVTSELDECVTELDPGQWSEVIRQLLRNSRFAMAMGGRLNVTLKPADFTQSVAELGLAGNTGWELTIQDNGIGMRAETLRRAWDPFFSTLPKSIAQGLGLTLVHSVVRWHGGQVTLESVVNEGSVVRIYLPKQVPPAAVSPEVTGDSAGGSVDPEKKPESRRLVLVVDDDPLMVEVIKETLIRSGLEPVAALDGAQALRVFKRQKDDLALIITDLTMPRQNGIQLIEGAREVKPGIRALFVSGDADEYQEEISRRFGDSVPVIKKPFELKEFVRKVSSLMNDGQESA